MIVHVGSAQSGHYYSFVKQPLESMSQKIRDLLGCTTLKEGNSLVLQNNVWFRCDDHKISRVTNLADALEKECFGGGESDKAMLSMHLQ